MQADEIPQMPEIRKEDFPQVDLSENLKLFTKSRRKIMMYETDEGQFMLLFEGLDESFYAGFVACLSQPEPGKEKVFTFLKLCLEGTRLIKQNSKKAYNAALKIERGLKKSLISQVKS